MTRGEIGRARGDGEAGEQTRKIIRERERRGGEGKRWKKEGWKRERSMKGVASEKKREGEREKRGAYGF